MRPALFFAAILVLQAAPGHADDCTGRLSELLATDLTAEGPYVALNTNVMMGSKQVFRQNFVSDSHYLVEQLEPEGMPDTLHYRGGAWHSDDAAGWKLAWQQDAETAAAGFEAQRKALSEGVVEAECMSETREGTSYEKVTGKVGKTAQFGDALEVGYLVDEATGSVVELTYDYKVNGIDVLATYEISRAPDLTLPLPPEQ